jgi:Domain of unknown function (DUF397)
MSLDNAVSWTKSTYCADSQCLEAALLSDGNIGVRDNKQPGQPHLTFAPNVWHDFLNAVAENEFRSN